jgi:hypothetical protein
LTLIGWDLALHVFGKDFPRRKALAHTYTQKKRA